MLTALFLMLFATCQAQQKNVELKNLPALKTREKTIKFPITEELHPFLNRLLVKHEKGAFTLYEDSLFLKECARDFAIKFGRKELIQVPDWDYPGEFLDTLIVMPLNASFIKDLIITGDFLDSQLVSISVVGARYKLVVDGQHLDNLPCFYMDDETAKKEGFVDILNAQEEEKLDTNPELIRIIETILEDARNGKITLYKDQFLVEPYEKIDGETYTSDVVQLPDPIYEGEFIDYRISTRLDALAISSVNYTPASTPGKYFNIVSCTFYYNLLYQGNKVGVRQAFSIDGEAAQKVGLVEYLNFIHEEQ